MTENIISDKDIIRDGVTDPSSKIGVLNGNIPNARI